MGWISSLIPRLLPACSVLYAEKCATSPAFQRATLKSWEEPGDEDFCVDLWIGLEDKPS